MLIKVFAFHICIMCIIFNHSSMQRVKLIFNSHMHCATLSDNNVVVIRNINTHELHQQLSVKVSLEPMDGSNLH